MQRNGEKGQALVFTALALTVLLGFAGLGIDMGVLRYQRRLEQSAADAVALAGASELCCGGGLPAIDAAAQNAATANGFTAAYTEVSNCESSGAAIGTTCVDVDSPRPSVRRPLARTPRAMCKYAS